MTSSDLTNNFYTVKKSVVADERGRITLGAELKTKQFRVLKNDSGQILLDSIVQIPERELWLWQNQQALALVKQSLQEANAREIHELESFADFAEIEVKD